MSILPSTTFSPSTTTTTTTTTTHHPQQQQPPSTIAPLCDTIITTLQRFPPPLPPPSPSSTSPSPYPQPQIFTHPSSLSSFTHEISTLRKFSDLIDRVRRVKPPLNDLEEEHWRALQGLVGQGGRCRWTLGRLGVLLGGEVRRAKKKARGAAGSFGGGRGGGGREYELHYNEPWKMAATLPVGEEEERVEGEGGGGEMEDEDVDVDVEGVAAEVSTLRAHVNLCTQTLQMSLQAINLVHQKRSRTSPETLQAHTQALAKAFTDLKMVLSRRWSLIDRESEAKIVLDDALFADVQRCYATANAIVHAASGATMTPPMTTSAPTRTILTIPHKSPGPVSPRPPSPRRPSAPTGLGIKEIDVVDIVPERRRPLNHREFQALERHSLQLDVEEHLDTRPLQRDSCTVEPLSIRPKELPRIEDKALPKIIPEEEPDGDPPRDLDVSVKQQRDPFDDSNVKHQGSPIEDLNGKHRGSFLDDSDVKQRGSYGDDSDMGQRSSYMDDSDGKVQGSPDSEEDPEPDYKETGFPPAVYAELIANLQQEVHRDIKAGNYDKAELAHLKAINYLTEREMNLRIPYENEHKSSMNEILAEIYVKQQQFDKAKNILNTLLKQEKADTDRKWRLYYMLAGVYLEQKRPVEAEKYAKRAYNGRDKTLGKGHGLILQSAAQLVAIYEVKGEPEAAQAFRNLYDADSIQRNQKPQVTKHIGTRRVVWNPDISIDINAPQKNGETPLVTAVTCGDDEMLQRVLQSGADVEARGHDGMSPLMHAVWHCHEKIAAVLISRGAKVDAPTAGWTPLHKACDLGDLAMVTLLLVNEADIEAKSPKKFFIKKKPAPNSKPNELSWSDEEDDDSDTAEPSRGWTPLLRAANTGKEAVVRYLLDRNADLEARNPTKATPLLCAAESRHDAIVDLLLLRGANVEAEDEFGWKPLHRTLVTRGGERVAQLLLDRNANINAFDLQGKTPLHHAVEKNDEDMTLFLLQAGANIEARDIAQRTPLFTAIECRLESMVFTLLEDGADASARDKNGRDALGAALHAVRKSPEITKLLQKHKKSGGLISSGASDSSRRGSRRESNAMSTASTAVSSFSGVSTVTVDQQQQSPLPPRKSSSIASGLSPRPESSGGGGGGSWWSRKGSRGWNKR